MAKGEREHIFDKPRNVRRVILALIGACVLSIVAQLFIPIHAEHPWEVLFGFYGIYGFVACVTLVLVAKELRKVLMRPEDYYDR